MTGAALRDILGDSRSAKCFFFNTKSSPRWDREGPRSGGCEMTILSSDLVGSGRIWSDIVGSGRIILESSFYWRKHSGSFR